jgi:hypothetical protein
VANSSALAKAGFAATAERIEERVVCHRPGISETLQSFGGLSGSFSSFQKQPFADAFQVSELHKFNV